MLNPPLLNTSSLPTQPYILYIRKGKITVEVQTEIFGGFMGDYDYNSGRNLADPIHYK